MRDTERTRTLRAETAWRRGLGELPIRKLHWIVSELEEMLPPVILGVTDVQQIKRRTKTLLGHTAVAVDPDFGLEVTMSFVLPTRRAIIVHEAAHAYCAAAQGPDLGWTHDDNFRRTMLWLVRWHYGVREGARLLSYYREGGLCLDSTQPK